MDGNLPATLAERLVVGPTYEIQADGTLVPGWSICVEHGADNCGPCGRPRFQPPEQMIRSFKHQEG